MLMVPARFNRNAVEVQAMGSPAETGFRLIGYMCERLGISHLSGLEVLDMGCGCRFAEAILAHDLPLKRYVGVDVDRELIDFLAKNTADPRLLFLHLEAHNRLYNPTGEPLSPETTLPIGTFDLACMFSVITHQTPNDAALIFRLLRRHIRADGRLFFSACLERADFDYREHDPVNPTALSIYSPQLMGRLLEESGWRVLSLEPPACDDLILDSIVCAPT